MTKDQVKTKLKKLHEDEDKLNKQMGKNNKQIAHLQKQNVKLAKSVSKNMLYRNSLISKL